METIKISVDVNVNLSKETLAVIAAVMGGASPSKTKKLAKTIKEDVKPEKEDVKPEKEDVKPEKEDVKPEKEDVKPEKEDVKPEKQLEVLRSLLRDKVADHREEIKAKLNDLGAASLTKLDPEKYSDMYRFLISLH